MKWIEILARYFLALWFLICVVDGWGVILFDVYLTGEPTTLFLTTLVNTTWFWIFLKIVQTIGTASLLFNYKPALGLALITPISAGMCLFYFFILTDFTIIGVLIIISTIILGRAYAKSYKSLLMSYPWREQK